MSQGAGVAIEVGVNAGGEADRRGTGMETADRDLEPPAREDRRMSDMELCRTSRDQFAIQKAIGRRLAYRYLVASTALGA